MVEGRYFFPSSARCVPAHARLNEANALCIEAMDGVLLAEAPIRRVKISVRLADLPRRLTFADGGSFETLDNDGVDALIGRARHMLNGGWIDRLERSWRAVVASIILAVLTSAAFVKWGMPAIALVLARETPPSVAVVASDQSLHLIDKAYLAPSELPDADRKKAQNLFGRVAQVSSCAPYRCVLLFRKGRHMGANAFALPDGRIVMTDALWKLFRNDDEIEGVFAHEIAHVRHAHGLQGVYEASLVPAAIAFITGDLSQVSQISVILPGVLIQSAYSRNFETEADRDAARVMRQLGGQPSAMADLLERLERTTCGKQGCGPDWLGDHPAGKKRAELLRKS